MRAYNRPVLQTKTVHLLGVKPQSATQNPYSTKSQRIAKAQTTSIWHFFYQHSLKQNTWARGQEFQLQVQLCVWFPYCSYILVKFWSWRWFLKSCFPLIQVMEKKYILHIVYSSIISVNKNAEYYDGFTFVKWIELEALFGLNRHNYSHLILFKSSNNIKFVRM